MQNLIIIINVRLCIISNAYVYVWVIIIIIIIMIVNIIIMIIIIMIIIINYVYYGTYMVHVVCALEIWTLLMSVFNRV